MNSYGDHLIGIFLHLRSGGALRARSSFSISVTRWLSVALAGPSSSAMRGTAIPLAQRHCGPTTTYRLVSGRRPRRDRATCCTRHASNRNAVSCRLRPKALVNAGRCLFAGTHMTPLPRGGLTLGRDRLSFRRKGCRARRYLKTIVF